MMLYKNSKSSFIEVIFSPRWTYISAVRNFFQNFLSITLANSKWAGIISMAASEFLENAVKYASNEGTKISVEYIKEDNKLRLDVENYSSPDHIKSLLKQIKEIYSGDPYSIYLKKIQEATLNTNEAGHLGLARIRYETNSDINVKIDGDLVKVNMIFDLN